MNKHTKRIRRLNTENKRMVAEGREWGVDKVGEGKWETQALSDRKERHSTGNMVNDTGIMLHGYRWQLRTSGAQHNVYSCPITTFYT